MATIQIQIMAGPQKGRRLAFTQSPITYGREADNAIVVANPHASRHHGELIFDRNTWQVVNHSPNGSRLNGKNIRKPTAVSNGDVVSIGDEEMFRVVIEAATPATDAAAADQQEQNREGDQPAEASGKSPMLTGRMKLWIGIAVYMVAAIVLMVVLSTLKDDVGADGIDRAPELTAQTIEREIRVVPEVESTNLQNQASEHLREARIWANRLGSSLDAAYRAHHNYQLALAYSGRTTFEDPTDQLMSDKVRAELTEEVVDLYRQGYAQLNAMQYREAIDTFSRLIRVYPDSQSEIYSNVEKHRSHANKAIGRRARN